MPSTSKASQQPKSNHKRKKNSQTSKHIPVKSQKRGENEIGEQTTSEKTADISKSGHGITDGLETDHEGKKNTKLLELTCLYSVLSSH